MISNSHEIKKLEFFQKKDRQIEGIQIFTIVFVFTHFFSIVFDLPSIWRIFMFFVQIRDHLSSETCWDILSLLGKDYFKVYRIICFPKSVKVAVMIIQFLKDEVTLLNRDSRLNQTYRRTVNAIYYLERNDN